MKNITINLLEEQGFTINPERLFKRGYTVFEKMNQFIYGTRLMFVEISDTDTNLDLTFISRDSKDIEIKKYLTFYNTDKSHKITLASNYVADSVNSFIHFMNNAAICNEFEKINYGRLKLVDDNSYSSSFDSMMKIYCLPGHRKIMNSSIQVFTLDKEETMSELYLYAEKHRLLIPDLLKAQIG